MSKQSEKIHLQLDPVLETLGLLFQCKNFDQNKKAIFKALEDLGLDAQKFYDKHMNTYETYVKTFQKHYVIMPGYDYLFDYGDSEIVLLLISLLIENRNLISDIQEIKEDEIVNEVIGFCKELFQISGELPKNDSLESIINFLENSSIKEQDKWHIMRFIQHPKQILSALVEMLYLNKDAFENAKDAVKLELDRQIVHYKDTFLAQKRNLFNKMKSGSSKELEVFPSLAFPLSCMFFSQTSYCGLLFHLIINKESMDLSKEELLKCLKALSDKSKFEILCSLKISPKYNLEIAEELGLTAATMSHHMGVLLASHFVDVNKQDGKIYYHINKNNIKEFIRVLEKTFL